MLFLGLMLTKFNSVIHPSSAFFYSKHSFSEEGKSAGFPLGLMLYTSIDRIKPYYLQIQVISHPSNILYCLSRHSKHLEHDAPHIMNIILGKIQILPKHHCISACSYRKGTKMFMSRNHRSSRDDGQRNKTQGRMKT